MRPLALGYNTLWMPQSREATSNLTNRDPMGQRLRGSSWHPISSVAFRRRLCDGRCSRYQTSRDWTDFVCSLSHLRIRLCAIRQFIVFQTRPRLPSVLSTKESTANSSSKPAGSECQPKRSRANSCSEQPSPSILAK